MKEPFIRVTTKNYDTYKENRRLGMQVKNNTIEKFIILDDKYKVVETIPFKEVENRIKEVNNIVDLTKKKYSGLPEDILVELAVHFLKKGMRVTYSYKLLSSIYKKTKEYGPINFETNFKKYGYKKFTTYLTFVDIFAGKTDFELVSDKKEKVISTLECPGLTTKRADGNTTRQIDFAIQKLFEGYEVIVEDHASVIIKKNREKINHFLLEKISNRLIDELKYENFYSYKPNERDIIIKLN